MWFSLFTTVLVLAIMFYQGLLGLFTATINALLTILAAALAFGLYENIYYDYLIDRQPEEGQAIALVGIFILSLLIMRAIVDLVIKDNMKFPIYVDRIGGGICGFVTAMMIIGVLSVGIQMLPFGRQFLGFSRYALYDNEGKAIMLVSEENTKKTEAEALSELDLTKLHLVRQRLMLGPDTFALGMVAHLSDNALGGENSFKHMQPDLLGDLFWARFTPQGQKTSLARKFDAVQVENAWFLDDDVALYTTEKIKEDNKRIKLVRSKDDKLPSGFKWLAVRVKLSKDATDDGTEYRFTTGQARLITRGKGGKVNSYPMIAVNARGEDLSGVSGRNKSYYYRLPVGGTVARKGDGRMDLVFEIPEDEEPSSTTPAVFEFRRTARTEITKVSKETPAPISAAKSSGKAPEKKEGNGEDNASDQSSSDGGSDGNSSSDGNASTGNKPKHEINKHTNIDPGDEARSGGRTKRYSADEVGSFFSDELPFELTDYSTDTIEVRTPVILGGQGRLTAKLNKDDSPKKGSHSPLSRFDVPDNMRLLQVSVRRLHPGSTLAQAMDFARQLGNVDVKDDQGKKYAAVGTWGIATVRRERLFECVYYDETTRIGSSAPPKLSVILRDDMNKDYALYYLFLIPPGKHIVSFEVPKGQAEDLRSANLVAPQ